MTVAKVGKKKILGSSIFAWIACYLSIFIFLVQDIRTIGSSETDIWIVALYYNILAGLIIWSALIFIDISYLKKLFKKTEILLLILGTIFLTAMSFLNHISYGKLFQDFAVFFGFLIGIGLYRLILHLPKPYLHWILFYTLISLLVYYSFSESSLVLKTEFGGFARNISLRAYLYSALLLIVTPLYLLTIGRKSWFWSIYIISLFLAHGYAIFFLSATRSSSICLIVLLLLSLLGFLFKVKDGVIVKQKIGNKLMRILLLSFLSIIALYVISSLVSDVSWESIDFMLQKSSGKDRSSQLRIIEALELFNIFNKDEILYFTGGGLGYSFYTPLGYEALAVHIGILTFLMKGGIFLFLTMAFIFYVRIPWLYFKGLLLPSLIDNKEKTAIITVIPGLIAYSILLLTSGGYCIQASLGLGIAYGAFQHIKQNGTEHLFK
jgi:hypothetical protein